MDSFDLSVTCLKLVKPMSMTISNSDGNDFDFGDPEFWEYYGLSKDIALAIAEGFPEYWLDVAGWYLPEMAYGIADRVAEKRRETNLEELADESIAGTRFPTQEPEAPQNQPPSWKQSDAWTDYVAKHHPEQRRDSRWIETDKPFKQLSNDFIPGEHTIGLDRWQKIASRLADQLEERSSRSSRRPPEGHKRRELLDDGQLFVDGARLARQDVLEIYHACMQPAIRWGPLTYPHDYAYSTNYFVIGVPQSGKTTLLRLLIQSVFARPDLRLVVYDHKTDLIPVLTPRSDSSTTDFFYIFNPYDARSVGWDIAADVTENSADTLAAMLIPARKEGEEHFFTRIPRNILAETIKILIQKARAANKKWTLLHLMLAIRSSNLRSVLAESGEGRETYKAHLEGDQQTQQNVRSELDDCSKRFLRIAAAWHRMPDKLVSLTEWARSSSSRKGILLGNNDMYRSTIQPLNQAILYFLCGELLDQTNPKHFRTFMVLDEFERLGAIAGLADTVHTSPGRNLNLVFGIHDFDTLRQHYGDAMHGILGTCGFKAFLRVENPSVADWLSTRIGNQAVRMPNTSTSLAESEGRLKEKDPSENAKDDRTHSSGTTTTTTNSQQYLNRRVVTPEAIMALYLPSAGLGLKGYFQGPPYSAFYKGHLTRDMLFGGSRATDNACNLWQAGSDKAFVPRSDADFQPPEDLFQPLQELGFERDDKPHTAPLRPPSRSTVPLESPQDTSPLFPGERPASSGDIDITDMPRRVRLDKDNNKLKF